MLPEQLAQIFTIIDRIYAAREMRIYQNSYLQKKMAHEFNFIDIQ